MTLPNALSRVVEGLSGVEILQHLDATHPSPLPIPPNRRVYRGQSKDYPLLPSLVRLIGVQRELVDLRRARLLLALCHLEARSLIRFAEHADRSGVALLGSEALVGKATTDLVPEDLRSVEESSLPEWPPEQLLPLIGAAQHYGVKTRLLDLTTDPMVALHFALSTGGQTSSSRDNAVLWVFNRGFLEDRSDQAKLVLVPTAGNENLRAQSGLFLADPGLNARVANDLELPYFSSRNTSAGAEPQAIRLVIRRSEEHELTEALKWRGYDGVRLFPSLKSAGDAVIAELYPATIYQGTARPQMTADGSQGVVAQTSGPT